MKKIICGVLMVSIAAAGPVFASGFGYTCKEFRLDGAKLKAKCLKATQAVWADVSSIDLNDHIGNLDGALKWDGSKFDKHCTSKSLSTEDPTFKYKPLLRATCKNNNGTYVRAEINLNERISNIDGKLRYDK